MQRLFIPSLFALMPASMGSASRLRRRVAGRRQPPELCESEKAVRVLR